MDLLDLLKLMFRRWYVTLPLIAAVLGAAVAVGQQIQPEYKTKAAILLVPPTTAPPPAAPGSTPKPGNPWLQVGEDAMAQAVQITTSSHDAKTTVQAAGGEADYEVGLVNRSSILTIDVTGTTRARALATVTAVTQLVKDEVARRQAEYRPKTGEQITTEVLDPGLDIAQSRSNVLRAQIVTILIGLLLTAVMVVVVDAVARRRSGAQSGRRRSSHRTAVGPVTAGQAAVEPRLPAPPPAGSALPRPGPIPHPAPAPAAGAGPVPHPPAQAAPQLEETVATEDTQRLRPANPLVPARRPAGPPLAPGRLRSALPDDTIVLTTVRKPAQDAR